MVEFETLARELALITPETLKSADNGDVFDSVPNFRLFFEKLQLLVSDNAQVEKSPLLVAIQPTVANTEPTEFASIGDSTTSTSVFSKKRPNSLTITTSSPAK